MALKEFMASRIDSFLESSRWEGVASTAFIVNTMRLND